MNVTTFEIDLTKNTFNDHGIDSGSADRELEHLAKDQFTAPRLTSVPALEPLPLGTT